MIKLLVHHLFNTIIYCIINLVYKNIFFNKKTRIMYSYSGIFITPELKLITLLVNKLI